MTILFLAAGRAGTQISSLPMTSNGTLNMTLPVSGATSNGKQQIVTKEGPPPQIWGSNSASPHSFMPYQMIAPTALPIVSVAAANNGNGNGNGKAMSMETVKAPPATKGKRASNGPGSRGGKRKNNNAAVMITPQTSMEPVKSGMGVEITSKAAAGGIGTGSGGGGGSASITLTNSKPAPIK